MLRLRRVHTGEEHLAPRGILDLRLVVYFDILVRFVWISLNLRRIDRLTLLHGNRTSHVGSTIQVRDRTILLTVDVALDRKRRVRLILIHWRASQRAYQDHSVGAEANHDDQHTHLCCVQELQRDLSVLEEVYRQCYRHNHAQPSGSSEVWNADQAPREEERANDQITTTLASLIERERTNQNHHKDG